MDDHLLNENGHCLLALALAFVSVRMSRSSRVISQLKTPQASPPATTANKQQQSGKRKLFFCRSNKYVTIGCHNNIFVQEGGTSSPKH